uniref:Uncharacterized protein n=1 Tax=Oryza meridionalis TaxID=40149 RepID=A0A0E0D286_9ORYZ
MEAKFKILPSPSLPLSIMIDLLSALSKT